MTVALVGDAVAADQIDSAKILLENDVDRAGNGVGTIDGRPSDGDDIDPVEQGRRDLAEIDGCADRRAEHARGGGRDEPRPVDEGKRALGTEIVEIDEGLACAETSLVTDRAVRRYGQTGVGSLVLGRSAYSLGW